MYQHCTSSKLVQIALQKCVNVRVNANILKYMYFEPCMFNRLLFNRYANIHSTALKGRCLHPLVHGVHCIIVIS